MATKLEQIRKV